MILAVAVNVTPECLLVNPLGGAMVESPKLAKNPADDDPPARRT
jgi:hypothetical protein